MVVYSAGANYQEYTANVNFGGYIGADQSYSVEATNRDEALEMIRDLAADDLEVTDIQDLGDGDWEVTVGFAGFIGVEETYSVYEEDEDAAYELALEEAKDELEIELI